MVARTIPEQWPKSRSRLKKIEIYQTPLEIQRGGSPSFAAIRPAAVWRGERRPDLGVRACVRTLAPPNPGIYHCVFAQRTAEIPKEAKGSLC